MRVIKRYRNRRLYDTEIRKAITRNDIKQYALQNVDFKIIDNSTQKDITIVVLSQVIGQTAGDIKKSGAKIIEAIIRKGGIDTMDIFKKLTLASIGAVNLTKEKLEEAFDELVKKGEMTSDEKAEAIKHFADRSVEIKEKIRDFAEEMGGKVAEKVSAKVNSQISNLSQKLDDINAKLGELEKRINK